MHLSCTVHSQNLVEPSFLVTSTMGEVQGLVVGSMTSSSDIFFTSLSAMSCFTHDCLWALCFNGGFPCMSIPCSVQSVLPVLPPGVIKPCRWSKINAKTEDFCSSVSSETSPKIHLMYSSVKCLVLPSSGIWCFSAFNSVTAATRTSLPIVAPFLKIYGFIMNIDYAHWDFLVPNNSDSPHRQQPCPISEWGKTFHSTHLWYCHMAGQHFPSYLHYLHTTGLNGNGPTQTHSTTPLRASLPV